MAAPALAQKQAAAKPPEICDLAVARDAGAESVTVTWSGGTPPFLVIRGDAPRFDRAIELDYLAERVMDHRYVDTRARQPGRSYYYQVYDFNSARELFSGPEHAHDHGDAEKPVEDKPSPDNNYCKGLLRRPATWK
jgi:hypothetical protein